MARRIKIAVYISAAERIKLQEIAHRDNSPISDLARIAIINYYHIRPAHEAPLPTEEEPFSLISKKDQVI